MIFFKESGGRIMPILVASSISPKLEFTVTGPNAILPQLTIVIELLAVTGDGGRSG
jgi:hypothetical protein